MQIGRPRILHRHRLRIQYLGICLLLIFGQAVFAANDRGLFYRAQRDGTQIYLLGSIHLGDDDMYPLRQEMEAAFTTADALAVELDVNRIDTARVATWMQQHGNYPAGETLRDHIQPQTWKRLSVYLRAHGIDPSLVQQQRPGVLVNMLTMTQLTNSGLSSCLGIDQHFLMNAEKTKKPVRELETVEDQLTLLTEMPNGDLLINQTLDEMDDLKTEADDLFKAWKVGDATQLEPLLMKDLLGDDVESRAFFARIYTQRNQAMTTHILTLSKTDKTLFVVVGSAHLLGDEGIVALLKKNGFSVEQL
jgi:uncharacterized protein YbaP (TraB family)